MVTSSETWKDGFITAGIAHLLESEKRIVKCLHTLEKDQVWWKPNDSSNSCGVLVKHLRGNINQYILSALGNQPDSRKRDKEFRTTNEQAQQLLDELHATVIEAAQIISAIKETQLIKKYHVQGFNLTGTEIVLHVVEHMSYHTGQIAWITKYIQNLDLEFYAGKDLNQTNE